MTEVLYLSYDGMTDQLGQSQVLPYLEKLVQRGYSIHLVSFEKKERYEDGSVEKIRIRLLSTGITWHPLPYTKNPPVLSTLLDLYRMRKTARALAKSHDIRFLHCRSYISGLVGLHMKRQKGIKFLFDMRGFWADERVEGGLWNLSNPVFRIIYNWFKKKEKEMLLEADEIVSLTERAIPVLNSWVPDRRQPLPVTVIPCCADLTHFNRTKVHYNLQNDLRTHLNLTGHAPVITYLGAIGTWYMLDEMLQFFKKLLDKKPGAVFLFITPENPKLIHIRAVELGVPVSQLRVYHASRDEVPTALSLGDVSLFFIKPVFSKTASSPTKQGEIMGMGIPLICNSGIGDTDQVVTKYHSGYLIDLADERQMERAIQNFDEIVQIDPEQITRGAYEFYSLEKGVTKYAEVYQRLAGFVIHDDTARP